jgi:hypothetical protein
MESLMARPRKPKAVKKPLDTVRRQIISIRGTEEWRDWLNRLSDHCRTDGAKLVDAALVAYAQSKGFNEPPPRR